MIDSLLFLLTKTLVIQIFVYLIPRTLLSYTSLNHVFLNRVLALSSVNLLYNSNLVLMKLISSESTCSSNFYLTSSREFCGLKNANNSSLPMFFRFPTKVSVSAMQPFFNHYACYLCSNIIKTSKLC